ncbi:MAG TPA: sigma-70 family RNA polymerase sigma factor [Saprospiraceae bacterium]|nr:sigma-70 family RNA polymerase sigma factor [Saprospiraceae bacterium]HRG65014.1 sigma-70 family RNA polymerase sigma factor [Saprospiraceae bacterium]
MDQAKLWQRLKQGDKSSLESIYEQNIEVLFQFSKKLCQDEERAMDHIHDLFVYIWENRAKLGDPAVIRAYLLKSLRNRIIDDFRKSSKFRTRSDSTEIQGSDLSREEEMIAFETETGVSQKLQKAMKELTDRQREIIFLKYSKNLSYEEIGEILGINYQSIRNLTHRAVSELRKAMMLIVGFLLNLAIFLIHK